MTGNSSTVTRGISSTGTNGSSSGARTTARRRADVSAGGSARATGAGGGERNRATETRFVGGCYVGSKLLESPVTGGGRVDRTVHAALAVRWATAEEPDWGAGVSNLQRVYTDTARSRIEGNEARVKPCLIGDGVELPCAWVRECTLGDSVVSTAELKVYNVTPLCGDLLRVEHEISRAVPAGTDDDSDVGSRDEGGSEGGDNGDRRGNGELHGAGR